MTSATTYYQTNLTTDITYLKGVGPQRGGALKRYGIENVGQLLHHFPRRYLDRTNIKYIREVKIGEEAVIIGKIASFGMQQARRRRFFQKSHNDINSIYLMDIGCALGVHAGPGSLAVGVQPV